MIKRIVITPNTESLIAYCARVSSSKQDNPDYIPLLRYCIKHRHWSPFEMAHATYEITTSRAISAQIQTHKSFRFQEFSQRYQFATYYIPNKARSQDTSNRQNSIDDVAEAVQSEWALRQAQNWLTANEHYQWAVDHGIARECARMVLPLQTQTKLYMCGSIRSWIHYFEVRCHEDTQLEHREIALAIRADLKNVLPAIGEALQW